MTFNCKSTTAASVQPKKLKSVPKMEGRTGHDGFSQWCTMYTIIQKWFTIISEWWLRFSRVILNSSAYFKIKTLAALWLCWMWFCCRGQTEADGSSRCSVWGKTPNRTADKRHTGQPQRDFLPVQTQTEFCVQREAELKSLPSPFQLNALWVCEYMSSFGGQRGEKLKLEGVFAERPSWWRRLLGLAMKDC